MIPTTAGTGAQLQWTVSTQLSGTAITYWIMVKNLTAGTVNFQGRYAILNA
jgi:alcohol dehydrogenase class IV